MRPNPIATMALVSGLAVAVSACGNNNTGATNATATESAVATPAVTDTTGASSHAAQFLTDAIQGDNAEIKFGQAAQKMGTTKGVKDFGKMLEDDHKKNLEQATKIANDMNVPVPDGTTPAADSELNMATSMSGSGFDKDFIVDMVKDHQKVIDEFQMEADSNDPAEVTDFARQSLPTLKKHLETAQSLQKNMSS